MKRTQRLTWLAGVSSAAILSLGLVGCGDDGGNGGTPDAGTDAPEVCEGHACPGQPGVALLPEGGVLRVEYLHTGNDPATGRIEAPMRAYMLAFQDQEYFNGEDQKPRPWLGELVYSSANMDCFDQTSGRMFFNAHHPEQQALADTRTYYTDLPASVDLKARNDGSIITMNSLMGEYDPADRVTHDQMFQGIGPGGDLIRGDFQDVAPMAPGSDFPGLDLVAGYDIPANAAEYTGTPGAYLAPDFDLIQPTEDNFYANPNYIDKTQPLAMEYQFVGGASIPDNAPTPVWFAGFASLQDYNDGAGGTATVTHLCLGPAVRSGTGTAEIPMGVFNDAGFAPDGAMITGVITHTAWANNDTHRFDLVAMNCDLGFYTTTPPAP